jgi:hypothetical protein
MNRFRDAMRTIRHYTGSTRAALGYVLRHGADAVRANELMSIHLRDALDLANGLGGFTGSWGFAVRTVDGGLGSGQQWCLVLRCASLRSAWRDMIRCEFPDLQAAVLELLNARPGNPSASLESGIEVIASPYLRDEWGRLWKYKGPWSWVEVSKDGELGAVAKSMDVSRMVTVDELDPVFS